MPPSEPDAYGVPEQGPPPAHGASGAPQPYSQQPYSQQPYGQQGPPLVGAYASWISRVGASLLDSVVVLPVLLVALGIGAPMSASSSTGVAAAGTVIIVIGYLAGLGVAVWNSVFRQGKTGQSLGKKVLGITLRKEATGQPIGAGLAFGRIFVHVLNTIPCYLGWVWPLWDAKKQTFTDKVLATVVVKV